MEVYIKNDKVVDLNYTATGSGIGQSPSGGRRAREKAYALSLQKIEEEAAAAEEPIGERDAFLEESGIVIEEHDRMIVAYMNGVDEGEGNIYPLYEQEDQLELLRYDDTALQSKEKPSEEEEEVFRRVF